ncbi:MAG: family 43 glycosylhydrolase [Clostridia bacterium]|nr:family 43 glycosylhydrolase [Clostridia bacterium]
MERMFSILLCVAILLTLCPQIVFAEESCFVAAYTTSGGVDSMDESMHLAVSDGGEYTALNFGMGVLYAEADFSGGNELSGASKSLLTPWIFNMHGGGYGILAKRVASGSSTDADAVGKALFWTSNDLITYSSESLIELCNFEIFEPRCEYDAQKACYVISYKNSAGALYANDTSDFSTFTTSYSYAASRPALSAAGIEGNVSCVISVDKSRYDALLQKLGKVTNVGVEKVTVQTNVSQAVSYDSLPSLTALYSDGSKGSVPVEWNEADYNKINFAAPGKYIINGTAQVADYPAPMITAARADPDICYYNGKYYFIATREDLSQRNLDIRVSETIEGIADAADNRIRSASSGCQWAPELHVIDGVMYLSYAEGSAWNYVQSYVMKLSGTDPTNSSHWENAVRIKKKDGTFLYTDGITLDLTYFVDCGTHYAMWAQRKIDYSGAGRHGSSDLWIATIDSADPSTLTSDPVCIRRPKYAWERYSTCVDEGPYALVQNGKVYITFSGNGVDNSYVLGLLSADSGDNLCDAAAWTQRQYPVLASEHVSGQYGPGHNAFTTDEYGRTVLVFHMKPNGGARSMTARTVHFGYDGTPLLYMTADDYLKEEYRTVSAEIVVSSGAETEDELLLGGAKGMLQIPDAENIRGNITLPLNGAYNTSITWTSSDESVISTAEKQNDGYDNTPAGVVTRGEDDKTVTLTATISLNGKSVTKNIPVTVKAAAPQVELAAYIYAYFRGSVNGEQEIQQIHIAGSRDGLNWTDLNGNFPIITSTMGTKGLRDPYLIRSPEGDKFFLIATDLDANGSQWTQYGTNGSQYLMVWESEDLINWSEQRMVKVGRENFGCNWAPEALYDEITGEYVMYWSVHRADLFDKKIVMYAKTRDFITFTEPEPFVMSSDGSTGYIDTTMIKASDGKYYRFTKREQSISTIMEVSDKLLGEYTMVDSNVTSVTGVEGPAIFKFNDSERYCLMLDGYTGVNSGIGFFPLVSDDIASGQFVRLSEGYHMPTGAKHGVILPVTEDEYAAILDKWGSLPVDDEGSQPIAKYTFESADNGVVEDVYGNNDAVLKGNATVSVDPDKGNVLTLDGTSGTYLALPTGLFDRRDTVTVSMDVKSSTTANFFFTFAIGNSNQKYFFLRNRNNQLYGALTITSNGYEETAVAELSEATNNTWMNLCVVITPTSMKIYKDGELAAQNNSLTKTISHLGSSLEATLGKSTYSADAYFNGSFDNVTIYNRALSDTEVMLLASGSDDPFTLDYETLNIEDASELTHDIELPTIGKASSCEIQWQISDVDVISQTGKVVRGDTDKSVVLTATLNDGNQIKTKTFNVTVLAKEEDAAYLFAYFTGNAAAQEKLFYGISTDGYNFYALNNSQSVLSNTLGTGCLRDPFIFKGEDGYYYIIATDMQSSAGWSSNHAIVVFKTADLVNITQSARIDYRDFSATSDCNRAWAPQAIWCPEKNAYMVYLAIQNPSDSRGTVMWRHYATDLCDIDTYTEPEFMLEPPDGQGGAIDGDIVYDSVNGRYIMYYDGKRIATSDSISGTFSAIDQTTQSEYERIPFKTSSGVSMDVEGSNIYKIIGEEKWIIAADGTSFNGGRYAVAETTDFISYRQLENDEYSFDFTPRHGYVIPISQRELDNLFDAYGKVDPDAWVSSADWTYKDIGVQTNEVLFSYTITPKEASDGIVGFAASATDVSNWNSFNMVVRIQPNGTFDARDGASFPAGSVTYEINKTYRVIVKANISAATYSVYVTDEDNNTYVVAKDYEFRSDAPAAADISKVCVRGGSGVAAGKFYISDFACAKNVSAKVTNFKVTPPFATFDITAVEDISGNVFAASYNDDIVESVSQAAITMQEGETQSLSMDVSTGDVKVFAWEDNTLAPYTE